MFDKIKRFFKKEVTKNDTVPPELIERITKENLFQFTDNLTMLVKDEVVLGKINKTERIKPGTLGKGKLTYIYLYSAECSGGTADFLTFHKALEWLLQRTRNYWI